MVDEKQRRPLTAVEFAPLDASASRRRFRISPVYLSLGLVLILAALSLAYLLAARAVIFRLDPGHAQVEVHGLSFHIGDNFLLLPGQHEVTAEADGYHPLDTTIDVTGDRTQEAELALEPLPGRLEVLRAGDVAANLLWQRRLRHGDRGIRARIAGGVPAGRRQRLRHGDG